MSGHADISSSATEIFASAGLTFPVLPAWARDQLTKVDDWSYTSRRTTPSPYSIDTYVREFVHGEADDYAVVSHAGHGVNSWAISYFVVSGRCGVFVQSAWGGAATSDDDDEIERRVMAERFAQTDLLLERNEERRDDDWLAVVVSDFHGQRWAWWPPGGAPSWVASDNVLGEALDWTAARSN